MAKHRRRVCFILIAAAWLGLGAPATARADAGESILDLGIGIGVPISGLDLTRFGGGGDSPGGAGLALSPQYLYQVSSSFGLGGELTYMNFPSANVTLPGGPAASNGDLLVIEGVGRYLTNPSASVSPYLVAGVGVGRMAATVEQGGATVLDTSSVGLEVSPGVGLKTDLGSKGEGALEFRWRLGTEDRSQFGTGLYNVLAFLLRVGWRS